MMAKAMFGAGCFWGIEERFRSVAGVTDVAVGYAGGSTEAPSYEEVCTGATGHAEVVEIDYDPTKVAYDELLEVFWDVHDPTTLNRQGPDVGTQYRSAIFTYDAGQEKAARSSKQSADSSGDFGAPIVTEISPAGTFWRAEDYHQQFIAKRRQKFGGLFR
jgi:peptide-methionine (S)-S-oxide reductase